MIVCNLHLLLARAAAAAVAASGAGAGGLSTNPLLGGVIQAQL